MKRYLSFICGVLLWLDLAGDGCLGKIKFVIHHPPPQAWGIDTLQADQEDLQAGESENFLLHSGRGNYQVALLPAPFPEIPHPPQSQPVTPVGQRPPKKIIVAILVVPAASLYKPHSAFTPSFLIRPLLIDIPSSALKIHLTLGS